jgi:putative ABC transport system permease protein
MNNLRYAFRQIGSRFSLSAIIVMTLALGIGATTAIYSLFHQILMQPLRVPSPHELVNLGAPGPKWGMVSCSSAGNCEYVFSYPMYRDLEAEQTVFSGIAAHRDFSANLSYRGETLAGSGMLVSGSYFAVLNVRPALGRLLDPSDEPRVGESAVVVLSHTYWINQFGADPDVLGRSLTVNGQPMTIVGVAPPGFSGTTVGLRPHVFVPLTMAWVLQPTFGRNDENRNAYWLYLFARLKPGMSIEQAAAAMNLLYGGLLNEVEAPANTFMPEVVLEQFRQRKILIEPGARGQSGIPETARPPLTLLLGVTGLVLMIACVNIANLLLARGTARAGEMAVRASVGARRGQLIAQLLTEAGVFALLGFVASIPVAMLTLAAIEAMLPPQVAAVLGIELSTTAVLFAAGLALATLLAFGMLPAWQASRTDPNAALKGHAGQPGGGRAMARFRITLATTQIAFSMVLLVLAGLFSFSLLNVARVELGLVPDAVVTFSVSPRLNGYSAEQALQLYERIEDELAAQPGVARAAASMVSLLTGNDWNNSLSIEGVIYEPGASNTAATNEVGPGFLDALGVPLLRGREFSHADRLGAPRVGIVNEAFARKFELGDEVIGKRFGIGNTAELEIEIVGLMADAKYSEVKSAAVPQYLLPWRQNANVGTMTFYVRTALDPNDLLAVIPRLVRSIDPDLPVSNLATMTIRVQENVYLDRLISIFSVAFALLATVLAALGLYGVLAYGIAQRTREFGLRLALGARPDQLRAMVLRQVAGMGLMGGAIGLAGAIVIGRYAEALLYGLSGYDPLVLAGAGSVLGAVVFVAGCLPAFRASRLAPMEALRYE